MSNLIIVEKSRIEILSFILTAILLTICCGLGFSKDSNLGSENIGIEQKLSANDSIVFDIIEILQQEKNLGENRREVIEKKINSFPDRVIRRDTASFFLQTVLEIAYNEFVTQDYEKAINLALNFSSSIEEPGLIDNLMRYSLIKFTPSALKTKEKHKNDSIDLSFDIFNKPVTEFECSRDLRGFFADLFEDLPMNLNLQTYKSLLEAYKKSGGHPSGLNVILTPGFYDHCRISGREDVLNEVFAIWDIDEGFFNTDNNLKLYKFVDPNPSATNFSEINKKSFDELSLSILDADGNIHVTDSLISINQTDSIGKYIENYQFLKFQKGENRDLIKISEKYEKYIPAPWKNRFYDYWGMALLSLGENEEALNKFSLAIENRSDKKSFFRSHT